MRLLEIENPPGVPHLAIKLLKLIGVTKENAQRLRFAVTFSGFVFMILIPKIVFRYHSLESAIIGTAELLFESNNFCGTLIIFINYDKYREFINAVEAFVQSEHFEPSNLANYIAQQHLKIHRAGRMYCYAILYAAHFYNFSPILFTAWSYYKSMESENKTLHFTLPMEGYYYGLAIHSSMRDYIIYAILMSPVIYLCALISVVKLLAIFSFTRYCTIYFQLVRLKIREVVLDHSFGKDLSSVIRMHQDVLHCAELLEELVSPVLLVQLILCVMIWSLMLLYFSVSGLGTQFGNLFVLFLITTIESFGYCYLGNELSDASANIERTLHKLDWYTEILSVQKDIQLMLLRSQKHVGITAGRFCFINMEQFGKLVKTAYSVFIVMKDQL
uniref:Uncharacterized protein n=1 Tax=Anopheles albimanus TaxID=7167 RepID=A0A182F1V2_ANOAL